MHAGFSSILILVGTRVLNPKAYDLSAVLGVKSGGRYWEPGPECLGLGPQFERQAHSK